MLTKIIEINPNWNPEIDGDNNRYIITYKDEGYTGFLPVSLEIDDPNFVQQWITETDNQIHSFPINQNGKYKFYFNNGNLGPFGIGYIPVKLTNQNSEDYDLNINVTNSSLQENIATLVLTNDTINQIKQSNPNIQYLELPNQSSIINDILFWNRNGQEYETKLRINIENLDPNPQPLLLDSNNLNPNNNCLWVTTDELTGNKSLVLSLTESQVQNGYQGFANNLYIPMNNDYDATNLIRFNELVEDPNDENLMTERVLFDIDRVLNDTTDPVSNSSKKRKLLDSSSRDIVPFVLPIYKGEITNSIAILKQFSKSLTLSDLNENQQFTFNIDTFNNSQENVSGKKFVGLRNFTIDLSNYQPTNIDPYYNLIENQSFTLTESPQTFTIPDSYNQNALPPATGGNLVTTGTLQTYTVPSGDFTYFGKAPERRSNFTNMLNTYGIWEVYGTITNSFGTPIFFGINYDGAITPHSFSFNINASNGMELFVLGSNDNNYLETITPLEDRQSVLNYINNNVSNENILYHIENQYWYHANDSLGQVAGNFPTPPKPFKYFIFIILNSANDRNWIKMNSLTMISDFKNGMKSVTITSNIPTVNNFTGYDSNNPLQISSSSGTISIPQGYNGLGDIEYEVDLPVVNNYNNYTSSTPLQLNSNGTGVLTIPSGYTGFGDIYYNVNVPIQTNKVVNFGTNGVYRVVPDSGYVAMSKATVNGVEITPDSGYQAMDSVTVNISNIDSRTVITRFNAYVSNNGGTDVTYKTFGYVPSSYQTSNSYTMNSSVVIFYEDGGYSLVCSGNGYPVTLSLPSGRKYIATVNEGDKYLYYVKFCNSSGTELFQSANAYWIGAGSSTTPPIHYIDTSQYKFSFM